MIRKILARLGLPTLCGYMSDLGSDEDGNLFKAFHYCSGCRTYRHDHIIDWLSRNEHILCGNCGKAIPTHFVFGFTFFLLSECKRIAKERIKRPERRRIGEKKARRRVAILTAWYLIAGIKKHLPADRNGATAADLEQEALSVWLDPVLTRVISMSDMIQRMK